MSEIRAYSKPPCLLWDVDGTLTDTTSLIVDSLDYVYQKYYQKTLPSDEIRGLIGTPLKAQIRVFGEPESFGVAADTVMLDFIEFYEAHKSRETIHADVIDLLIEGKKRGFPTALITSKNREELANTLPRLQIDSYIDFSITADDIPNPKPAPDGILLALKRMDIPPSHAPLALYIGDTLHDMNAASSAGIRGVGVTWGAATRQKMLEIAPAFLCDAPEELRIVLFGH